MITGGGVVVPPPKKRLRRGPEKGVKLARDVSLLRAGLKAGKRAASRPKKIDQDNPGQFYY